MKGEEKPGLTEVGGQNEAEGWVWKFRGRLGRQSNTVMQSNQKWWRHADHQVLLCPGAVILVWERGRKVEKDLRRSMMETALGDQDVQGTSIVWEGSSAGSGAGLRSLMSVGICFLLGTLLLKVLCANLSF